MVSLFFICPNTNQRASAGIETDPDSLRACSGGAPSKSNARTAARSTESPFAKPTSVTRCNTLGRTSDKKATFQSHFGTANENGRARYGRHPSQPL